MAAPQTQAGAAAAVARRLVVAAGRTLVHGTTAKVGERSVVTEKAFHPGDVAPCEQIGKAEVDRLVELGVLTEKFVAARPNTVSVDKEGPSVSHNHEATLRERPVGKIA